MMSQLTCNVYHDDTTSKGVVVLESKECDERKPVQIIFVIDISASMNAPAVCKGENGEDKNNGYSNLDINKHGVITSLDMMSNRDYACVVVFDSNAVVLHDWIQMDDEGKSSIKNKVYQIKVAGATNLTECITTCGKQMLSSPLTTYVNSALLLYTDGSPTVDHLSSHLAYKQLLDVQIATCLTNKEIYYLTFTLGIGPSIDSDLLQQLGVQFFHIPYTQFLMAFTVHIMATIMTTYSTNYTITCSQTLTGTSGPLLYGFKRHFTYTGDPVTEIMFNSSTLPVTRLVDDKDIVNTEHLRYQAVKAMRTGMPNKIKKLMDDDDMWPELYHTLSEVHFGLSNELHKGSWGKHYYKSISNALYYEVKSNNLDQCILKYVTPFFDTIVDMGCSSFGSIAPPEPSLVLRRTYTNPQPTSGRQTAPTPPPPPPSRQQQLPDEFMRGGGCMDGDTLVFTLQHSFMNISTINEIIEMSNP